MNKILFLILIICTSCFNYQEAISPIELDKHDILIFSQLKNLIITDLERIEDLDCKHKYPNCDENFFSFGENSLNQIDQSKYKDLIQKLKQNGFSVSGWVNTDSVVSFVVREKSDRHWDDYDHTYTHELVYNREFRKMYQNNESIDSLRVRLIGNYYDVKQDSSVETEWRYYIIEHLTGW